MFRLTIRRESSSVNLKSSKPRERNYLENTSKKNKQNQNDDVFEEAAKLAKKRRRGKAVDK